MSAPVAFLSHATKDAALVTRLAEDLRAQGIDVWYSKWEIKPGDSLRMKIDEGLDAATYFMVLLTPNSLASKWVQTEMDTALVDRIAGKCRLIPILSGITHEDVPATLRGLVWVKLEPYDEGLRKLIEACFDVSSKPPLGAAPVWANERPLAGTGLSAHGQRLAHWLNEQSKVGASHESYSRDTILSELNLTPEQAGMAASELEDEGYIKLSHTMGDGPARFSHLWLRPVLFIKLDPILRGWSPMQDARELAATLVNLCTDEGRAVSLMTADQHLGWGPRRLNPAADYLDIYAYVQAVRHNGSGDDTYAGVFVNPRTRRFAQSTA